MLVTPNALAEAPAPLALLVAREQKSDLGGRDLHLYEPE
jgi:hypothetical protein